MKLKQLLLFWAIFTTLGTLQAQDVHFSLFNMSPFTLNPALTGAFEGTARIGGIYRDQWSSFLPNQFTTNSFNIDAPIIRGFRKNDWVGIGMMTLGDQAGTARLKNNVNMLNLSYHLALGQGYKTMLTLGLQGGRVNRSINLMSDGLQFEDELDLVGGTPGSSQDRNFGERKEYFDFGAGLMLRTELNRLTNLEVGLAFFHITQPNYSFGGAGFERDAGKRPMRIAAHATYNQSLTDKWSIAPTLLFQTTAGSTQTLLQGWGGYQINPDFKLNFGAGYRFADAGQVLLGMDYQSVLRVALGYDVNVSSLSEVTNFRGGFEIAAWYILKMYKKPDVKPTIICPKF
jgi:type IX secretion system PorP/SprF family membrane protein